MKFKQKILSMLICFFIFLLNGCMSFNSQTNNKNNNICFFLNGIVTNQVQNSVAVTLNAVLLNSIVENDDHIVLLQVEFINLCNQGIFIKAENTVNVLAATWENDEFSTIYFEDADQEMKLCNEKYVYLSNKNYWFNSHLGICDNGSLLFEKKIRIINRPHMDNPSNLLISINSHYWRIGSNDTNGYSIGKILNVSVNCPES